MGYTKARLIIATLGLSNIGKVTQYKTSISHHYYYVRNENFFAATWPHINQVLYITSLT